MSTRILIDYLETHGVYYKVIEHPVTYTATGTAEAAHVSSGRLAKTVMVVVDGEMAMAVLAAPEVVDIAELRRCTGDDWVRFASEEEFVELFHGIEPGAMPPFGNLFDMRVWVDSGLARQTSIAFNAGTHSEAVELAYADFERLVRPTVCRFAEAHATAA